MPNNGDEPFVLVDEIASIYFALEKNFSRMSINRTESTSKVTDLILCKTTLHYMHSAHVCVLCVHAPIIITARHLHTINYKCGKLKGENVSVE